MNLFTLLGFNEEKCLYFEDICVNFLIAELRMVARWFELNYEYVFMW